MLTALRQIVQAVNDASNLDEALQLIVREVKASMSTDVCSIYLKERQGQRFRLMATSGLNPSAVGLVSMDVDQGLVGMVANRAEAVNIESVSSHSRNLYFPETGEEQFSSFLGAPIIHNGEVLGVLVVQKRTGTRFDEASEAFLITISAQLAARISHATLTGTIGNLDTLQSKGSDTSFSGASGAPGVAIGTAIAIVPAGDLAAIKPRKAKDQAYELDRFDQSVTLVRGQIERQAEQLAERLNKEERELFNVYQRMLDDNALGGEIRSRIEQGYDARSSVAWIVHQHVQTFKQMTDEYFRERAVDLSDLGARVLAALDQSHQPVKGFPDSTILVSEELTASMITMVPADKLVGLVSSKGSLNSHGAILARALGIPTVLGVEELPYDALDQRQVIVDGYEATVFADPSDLLMRKYHAVQKEDDALALKFESLKDEPAETKDGVRISLLVNTGLSLDIARASNVGADGVGLYRSEMPFIAADRFPSEEEQRVIYEQQLRAFQGKPVTIRTLDIGGDKSLPYFPISEDNPFLGWRGIRVTLDHPEIFLMQVRAMMKASMGLDNLRILLPMVTELREYERAHALIRQAHLELIEEGFEVKFPKVGVMIEVPAAVYQAGEFAKRADFLSVGSNDLIQYLLAVDRSNARVAQLYSGYHPAVLAALRAIVKAANKHDTPVTICGEIAGDPVAASLLLAMGYTGLSMNATSLPRIKSLVRQLNFKDAKEWLKEARKMEDARQIRKHLNARLKEVGVESVLVRGSERV